MPLGTAYLVKVEVIDAAHSLNGDGRYVVARSRQHLPPEFAEILIKL